MNLDRKKVNMTQLKANQQFRGFLEILVDELRNEREMYEATSPASDYLRGRVSVLKDIINSITGKG